MGGPGRDRSGLKRRRRRSLLPAVSGEGVPGGVSRPAMV